MSNKVANLYVHDNVIKVNLSGTSGLVGRPASYEASANNRFVAQHLLRHRHFQEGLGLEHLPGRLEPVARLRKRHDRQPSDLVDHPGPDVRGLGSIALRLGRSIKGRRRLPRGRARDLDGRPIPRTPATAAASGRGGPT